MKRIYIEQKNCIQKLYSNGIAKGYIDIVHRKNVQEKFIEIQQYMKRIYRKGIQIQYMNEIYVQKNYIERVYSNDIEKGYIDIQQQNSSRKNKQKEYIEMV